MHFYALICRYSLWYMIIYFGLLKTIYRTPSCFIISVSSCAGKVVNLRRLDEVISSINGWYMDRGLFGLVSTYYIMVALFCK